MIVTTQQLQPLQTGVNCLLNFQAIAGSSKGDSKMTSKVISDFKILNNIGKTSLLEVRIVVTGDKVGEGCD